MSTLSRDTASLRKHPQTIFTWQLASRNHYWLLCGSDMRGSLSFSLERSILFKPNGGEFYRARAEAGDLAFSFKCVFLNGTFRGSVAVGDETGQPLTLYQERFSKFSWGRRSRIVLCHDGTAWSWLGNNEGSWVVRSGLNRILELKSTDPQVCGTIRVHSPSFLRSMYSHILILFCIYLAIGPKRKSSISGETTQ